MHPLLSPCHYQNQLDTHSCRGDPDGSVCWNAAESKRRSGDRELAITGANRDISTTRDSAIRAYNCVAPLHCCFVCEYDMPLSLSAAKEVSLTQAIIAIIGEMGTSPASGDEPVEETTRMYMYKRIVSLAELYM